MRCLECWAHVTGAVGTSRDRAPFIVGVVKSRTLTVRERTYSVHGDTFWKAVALKTEIEIDFQGRHPVVLYKFIL
jgi:hypothetical protein